MVEFMQLADTQFGMRRWMSHQAKENPQTQATRQQRWIDNGFVKEGELPNPYPVDVTDMAIESENYSKVLNKANETKPAFVMVCGDLINNLDQLDQRTALLEISEQLNDDIPLRLVPGNHDLCPDFYNASPEALQEYRNVFGDDYYSFVEDEALFIGLNSEIFDSSDLLGNEYETQMEFLKDTLNSQEAKNAHSICAFMHKPLFLEDPLDDGGYGQLKPTHRKDLMNLLEESRVSLMLAGHLHHNREAEYKNLKLIATGAVGYPIVGSCGYRTIALEPEAMTHRYHEI